MGQDTKLSQSRRVNPRRPGLSAKAMHFTDKRFMQEVSHAGHCKATGQATEQQGKIKQEVNRMVETVWLLSGLARSGVNRFHHFKCQIGHKSCENELCTESVNF